MASTTRTAIGILAGMLGVALFAGEPIFARQNCAGCPNVTIYTGPNIPETPCTSDTLTICSQQSQKQCSGITGASEPTDVTYQTQPKDCMKVEQQYQPCYVLGYCIYTTDKDGKLTCKINKAKKTIQKSTPQPKNLSCDETE